MVGAPSLLVTWSRYCPGEGPLAAHYSAAMPFPRRLLNDFETVRLDLHPHWWYITPPFSAFAVTVALMIYALTLGDSSGAKAVKIIAVILLVIAGMWALSRYVRWYTTYFVVTSDRVIFRQGVLRKVGVQIPLERVNNVNFSQTIFERMLGAGDLLIESGGEDGAQRFTDIKHPDEVTNEIHAAMEDNDRTSRGYSAPQADYVDQLERLEAMRDRGSISEDEFQEQKRRLLG